MTREALACWWYPCAFGAGLAILCGRLVRAVDAELRRERERRHLADAVRVAAEQWVHVRITDPAPAVGSARTACPRGAAADAEPTGVAGRSGEVAPGRSITAAPLGDEPSVRTDRGRTGERPSPVRGRR